MSSSSTCSVAELDVEAHLQKGKISSSTEVMNDGRAYIVSIAADLGPGVIRLAERIGAVGVGAYVPV